MASAGNFPPGLFPPLPDSLVKARGSLIRYAKKLIARYEDVEQDIRVPAPVTPSLALFASFGRFTSTLCSSNFNVPEGTLTLALLHAVVFLRPNGVSLAKISLQPRNVIMKGEFYRLFTSAFTHVDVPHALFNVTALIEAGNFLEMQMGAIPFIADVALITLTSQGLYVAVAWMQHILLDRSTQYYSNDIGFTPVNFALRTVTGIMMHAGNPVTQHLHPGLSYCLQVWIDLAIMRICFPQSNFFAHLIGIGAGLIRAFCPGPFLKFRKKITSFVCSLTKRRLSNRSCDETFLVAGRRNVHAPNYFRLLGAVWLGYMFGTKPRKQ